MLHCCISIQMKSTALQRALLSGCLGCLADVHAVEVVRAKLLLMSILSMLDVYIVAEMRVCMLR